MSTDLIERVTQLVTHEQDGSGNCGTRKRPEAGTQIDEQHASEMPVARTCGQRTILRRKIPHGAQHSWDWAPQAFVDCRPLTPHFSHLTRVNH